MAVIEYSVLIGFSISALIYVLGHHPGTFPPTKGWLSLTGINGKGNCRGALIAVFMYTGWDATVYVNEEVKHRRVNLGRAAVFAVALFVVLYVLPQVGTYGVASPKSGCRPTHLLGAGLRRPGTGSGGGRAKVMAFALALSVIASTNVGIVITSRIAYGMASHRVLPPAQGNASRRYSTPAIGTVITAVILIAATSAYLLVYPDRSDHATDVVSVTGLLFAGFYTFTALAAVMYYRRFASSVTPGTRYSWASWPLASAVFLAWVVVVSLQTAPGSEKWSLVGIIGAGLVLMLVARFILRSPFFRIPLESAAKVPLSR